MLHGLRSREAWWEKWLLVDEAEDLRRGADLRKAEESGSELQVRFEGTKRGATHMGVGIIIISTSPLRS